MKLLLDESLPYEVRTLISGHDVFTVKYMGWNGIANGKLLNLAASNGFDALITTDRGYEFEQDALSLPISVIIVIARSNKIDDIRPLVPQLLAELGTLKPRSLAKVG
jgi:hypothetical protein